MEKQGKIKTEQNQIEKITQIVKLSSDYQKLMGMAVKV